MYKIIIILSSALLLNGCAIAVKTYLSDGSEGYSVDCSGKFRTWDACYRQVGQKCGTKGYNIIDKIEKPMIVDNVITYERSLLISCKSMTLNNSITAIDTNTDFRGFNWGASIEDVKKFEKGAFISGNKKNISYRTTFSGINVTVLYTFSEDRLVEAMYINEESYLDKNNYISDFHTTRELLQKEYGQPVYYGQIWKNDLYKNNPSKWGEAVSLNHLGYVANWDTDKTLITIVLSSGNPPQVNHGIIYKEKVISSKRKNEQNEILD